MIFKYVDGLPFVPVTYPANKADGLYVENLQLDPLVTYINKKEIKKAFLDGIVDFEFLADCHSIQHLVIRLETPFSKWETLARKGKHLVSEYCFRVLYDLPLLKSLDIRDCEPPIITPKLLIDISKIKGLEYYSGNYKYIENLACASSLKTIWLYHYTESDFRYLTELKQLDTLDLTSSNITSLNGCEKLPKLQCLYLHYNRSLQDISALEGIRDTLKALRIEACGKIRDLSVLEKLENLELLELSGNNEVPNLNFLKKMHKLKTFIFSMNVLDGNLWPCMHLPYVYSEKNRKHYDLKDSELPKGQYVHGNESIEEWRRLE